MTKYRIYTRDLPQNKRDYLRVSHKFHLENKGFLTKNQKKRLLGLGRKERGTTDSDFWYRLKHSAQMALLDLQLIAEVGDELQLKEIFEPFTNEDYNNMNKNLFKRTQLRNLIEALFTSHSPEKSHRDDWRYKIAEEMVTIGIGYVKNIPALQSNLHTRLFQDVQDAIGGYTGSTQSTLGVN